MSTAMRYGKLGLIRAKDAEKKLRDRDLQLGTYTAENRQLKASNDNLKRTIDSLKSANYNFRQSADLYNTGVKHLYAVNELLQKDAKKDFTLSFFVGYGLGGDKAGVGPKILLGLGVGYSIFKF